MKLFPHQARYFIKPAAIILVLLMTFLAYSPGLTGNFMLDDETVITNNPSLIPPPTTFRDIINSSFSSNSGSLKRPVSMFTFAVNSYFTGNNPYYFKLTNVFIHISNGLLLFTISWLLLSALHRENEATSHKGDAFIPSVFIASIWLLHPLNVSSVLYISQRMALLSAFFTLLGIAFYCLARSNDSKQKTIIYFLSTFIICWPLATLSKENGILLPAYLFLIECFFFKFKSHQIPRRVLITFFAGLILIAVSSAFYFFPNFADWLETGYRSRAFTLSERFFTEGRALWLYISFIFLPIISRMGLHHDDFTLSTGIISPITTLLSLAGIIALFIACIIMRKRFPLISWGILIFFTAHIIESTILPLELIFEHRNYLASIGLLIPLGYYTSKLSKYFKSQSKLAYILLPIIVILGVLTTERSSYWGHPFLFYSMEADNHPQSSRANYDIGIIYAKTLSSGDLREMEKQTYHGAKKHFIAATQNSPDYTGGLFGLINMNSSVNIKIEDAWIYDLENRLSTFPVTSMSTSWISNFVNCKAKPTCPIQQDLIQRLLVAATENKFITNKRRAILLSAYAGFSANTMKDFSSAIQHSLDAIKLSPHDPLLQINISQLYMAARQLILAENALNKASSLNTHNQHTKSIEKSKKLLSSLRQSSSKENAH